MSNKKNKGGAPINNKNAEKSIDWDMVDKLIEVGCIGEEIASVLRVDYDTIANHCKKEKNMLFSDYIKTNNNIFKVSLRRMQYRSAMGMQGKDKDGNLIRDFVLKPSVSMQIWLGKQYLNQTDKQQIETAELPEGFSIELRK